MRKIYPLLVALWPLLFMGCTTPDNGDDYVATYLTVNPTEITFKAGADNTFTVDSDGDWIITSPETITLSTTSGTRGITPVLIESVRGTSIQTLTVRTPSNTSLLATIKITNEEGGDDGGEGDDDGGDDTPTESITLYYDNLDGDTSYTKWANNSDVWQNPVGEGSSSVSYESSYATLRNDRYGSSGKYTGASGNSYMRIYEPSNGTNYLEVHNIAINGNKRLTFSFGSAFKASQCDLYIKCDNSGWIRLEYTSTNKYNSWALAEAAFTLVGSVKEVGFRIEPIDTNVNYGYNIDDLRLVTSEGGQNIEIKEKANYRWAEMPEKTNSKTDYLYHTHWSTTYSSKKRVRNYSYCYDVRRHSPMWIAHPQHAIYEEGGKTRPASDPWARDPYLTDSESAIIYKINGYTCSLRTYYDSSYQNFYQWGRGHMLPSGYRGCGNANNPAEINVQTFYSSNVAAQRSGTCAFQTLWSEAERKIQDDYICSDTLYVVSGAHFANERTTATDANIFYLEEYCKTCIVPTHFYKIVLRTKSGSTGKAIQECSAEELKAVGFWFSNTDVDEQTGLSSPTLSSKHLRSVAEIEQLTGNEFDFFPDVPDSVKSSYTASEWGF